MSKDIAVSKITIKIGDNEITLTLEEAKALKAELNKLIASPQTNHHLSISLMLWPTDPPRRSIFDYPQPYNPYQPMPFPGPTWYSTGSQLESSLGEARIGCLEVIL